MAAGTEVPEREYGPLTLLDTVRWAGVQENAEPLHWDREHARTRSGMKSFIASGGYRQALLARTLTDWIGPQGELRRMRVRHLAPTSEGDRMRFRGHVLQTSGTVAEPWVVCEVEGRDQDDRQILTGQCTLALQTRQRRQ